MDKVSRSVRSATMRAVRSKDSKAELLVRKLIHSRGYRYRLHVKNLPGKPDLVFPSRKCVIFIHGCFWHGHNCRPKIRPTSNTKYWDAKIIGNRRRDRRHVYALRRAGWHVLILWECEIKNHKKVLQSITSFLR